MRQLPVAAAICVLTLLNFFQFPGHTYLQADTQIYVPILEHLWDPSVLSQDLIVQKPHVSFTLYDEIAEGLRKLTSLPFRELLETMQILCRGLGIWGLYLIASATGLSPSASLLVTSIVSLGATIAGPSVLSFEYEPTPRGLAAPLLFLGIGLIAQGRYLGGAVAGSVAFLLHAPTAYPFWDVYAVLALRRRKLYSFAPLLCAALLLWLASRAQGGGMQAMTFFTRLDPAQESLQRMRASYNWISVWGFQWMPHYVFLYLAAMLAVFRLRKLLSLDLRFFAIGLPLIGILSAPISYLMLEKLKLAFIPQFQPMRALLFVTVMATLLAAVAACVAVRESRYWEAMLWFGLAYLIPVNTKALQAPSMSRSIVIVALAGLATVALWARQRRFPRCSIGLAVVGSAAFFAIPICGNVINYPQLHHSALSELCVWGRSSTPKDAIFLFPDARQELYPGVFRAEGLRAVYVDWKAGGQVNYFKDFGEQWLSRWQEVMLRSNETDKLASLGIDFIVLKADHKLPGRTPQFENSGYVVYSTR